MKLAALAFYLTRSHLSLGVRPTNKDMLLVECRRHGPQEETFVCEHVVQSLRDGRPRGFYWSDRVETARGDAWCSTCNEALQAAGGEWTAETEKLANVKLLCGACYDEAKRLNGF